MAIVPLRFANTRGIPMIEVQSVTNTTTTTTFMFNDHPQRNAYFYGGFFVKLPKISTGSNVVEFATIGSTGSNIPLYLYDGNQAVTRDLVTTSGGVVFCFYDRTNNRLQVLGIPQAATTNSSKTKE